ncbi:MAG: DNA primase [Candidatus Delongbacteria bacterium]|nr:DNA primase [Candidatus Delongbacteria bacterium]MCG2760567.1 DNA primase [Candidatus Delongbacteria bacterium]
MIPKEQIEKLQNSVDIVDVIGERIDLRRSGANYKSRCPFHDEKTPSFMVSQSKQIFKCFGCGASGDSIKFVMSYDNLSYPDAIRHIAARYGIEIVETYEDKGYDRSADDKKELFRLLNKFACDFFYENLLEEYKKSDSKVVGYLKSRNIEKKFVDKFRLGFAPDDWHLLRSDRRFNQYDEEILVEAGLRKKNEKGNIYDQFRNRLMFPVFDNLGNTVAFSGRTLDDEIQPKYLNSPETVIYKKSQVLYGLHQALDTIRKTKEIILVEGNIDLITMHKFGFSNTVAICGTAFTENHALLIKRNADKITVLLDGDEAGKKSALRTSEILISNGLIPSIVVLPDDADPDSFLYKNGKDDLSKSIINPLNIIELNLLLNDHGGKTVNNKAVAAKAVIETLKNVNDGIILDLFLKEASSKLGIDISTLKKELASKHRTEERKIKISKIHEGYIVKNEDLVEFNIIYLMLSDEGVRKIILSEINEKDFRNKDSSRLFLKIYELFEEGETIKLNNILFDFDENFKDFMVSFVLEQEKAFFGEAESVNSETAMEKIRKACSDGVKKIRIRKIGQKIKNLNAELKYTDDADRQNEILEELSRMKTEQREIV